MTLTPIWGTIVLLTVCPILGGLPLIAWITHRLTGKQVTQLGTGNISVSAAFYHGGKLAGILAVLSEAGKGIVAVLLARFCFPNQPTWELVALVALVVGRYGLGRGAGTTNVVWGYGLHDWQAAGMIGGLSGLLFAFVRRRKFSRKFSRYGVLGFIMLVAIVRHPQDLVRIGMNALLCLVFVWIYGKMADDLDLTASEGQVSSRNVFRFLRGQTVIFSLDDRLDAKTVGQKAVTLAQLKNWGYVVPPGWVLPVGKNPITLIKYLRSNTRQPDKQSPFIVRSSAIGEDSTQASAAGQYESIPNITTLADLDRAIARCRSSYQRDTAVQYRRDRNLAETGMAVIVQRQIQGVFSGVAFSRDPIVGQGDAVVIEAVVGETAQVVSGQVTPEQYQVLIREDDLEHWIAQGGRSTKRWLEEYRSEEYKSEEYKSEEYRSKEPSHEGIQLDIFGEGQIPRPLIQQVALLARDLEERNYGIPQDIEWTYDGETLWLLQARSITTLNPIWTRKIAAEVIPGLIRPLTWSINQPLTCGVWGKIFTIVLANRAKGLDFRETATLHSSRAYFNASLLGEIFLRMGLPPESLEFLTRGAKFSKPPITSTLRNLPGLARLLGREIRLEQNFAQDDRHYFTPGLAKLAQPVLAQPVSFRFGLSQPGAEQSITQFTAQDLLARIDFILELLEKATYYSILAPLSLAIRQAIFRVKDEALDNSQLPEVVSLRSIQALAATARSCLPEPVPQTADYPWIVEKLAESPKGQDILTKLEQLIDRYGYLSEVGTDIAIATWKEDPRPVHAILTQFVKYPPRGDDSRHNQEEHLGQNNSTHKSKAQSTPQVAQTAWKVRTVQKRVNLKGQVATVYLKLLAELRWSFVALEILWQKAGLLSEHGSIFFLELYEIRQWITTTHYPPAPDVQARIARRQSQLEHDEQMTQVPFVRYGNAPGGENFETFSQVSKLHPNIQKTILRGIGASVGEAEGTVKILLNLSTMVDLEPNTILVVPYTDAGWAPWLARAAGVIAEVGGRLSHGAIVAREYGIPAVMNITHATEQLQDGQQIRINGGTGTVEILT